MRKLFTFLLAISILGLVSCEKDSTPTETPGNIPGLGKNTAVKPEVKEVYVLPSDIVINGKITGLNNLKSANGATCEYGSGADVRLKLTLQNTSSTPRTIFLPKGLVWASTSNEYQHGLQLQTIWISLAGKQSKEVIIDLYCANLGLKELPHHDIVYQILGVTNSKIIAKFLDMIGWRMINIEMISNLKSAQGPTFDEITAKLQSILHKLTDNGEAISDEDIAFIESIPEVTNPAARALFNKDVKYPNFIEEYSELVKK